MAHPPLSLSLSLSSSFAHLRVAVVAQVELGYAPVVALRMLGATRDEKHQQCNNKRRPRNLKKEQEKFGGDDFIAFCLSQSQQWTKAVMIICYQLRRRKRKRKKEREKREKREEKGNTCTSFQSHLNAFFLRNLYKTSRGA